MNRRLLGNLLVVSFLVLLLSGLFMFFIPFKKTISSTHTIFALLFIVFIMFHILNNKRIIWNYILGKSKKARVKFQFIIIIVVFLFLCIAIYLDMPIVNNLYNWGNEFRNNQMSKREETFDYQIIKLDKTIGAHEISIELKKGIGFKYPLFAVWVEDTSGNYVETLYISRVISTSTYYFNKKIDGKYVPTIVRRPEALPYWSHKRGVKASDGLYIPLDSSPDLDAVSGATPTSNFILQINSDINNLSHFKIFLEVNQSYDWNEYYTKNKFPEDSIYSSSGEVGQPALVYSAEIRTDDLTSKPHNIMNLVGHSHHSGKNGKLFTDLSNITTAKMIADRIIITIE